MAFDALEQSLSVLDQLASNLSITKQLIPKRVVTKWLDAQFSIPEQLTDKLVVTDRVCATMSPSVLSSASVFDSRGRAVVVAESCRGFIIIARR